MPKAIKKAGIGLIIPRKLLEKKGKKNFDKGKEMLGPLMGMMKEGGEIPKIPELPRTYLAYKRQAKKNMGGKTGTDLYKNIMLTKDEFKYYKNLQKLENQAKKKGKVISTADIVKGAEGAVIGEDENKKRKYFTYEDIGGEKIATKYVRGKPKKTYRLKGDIKKTGTSPMGEPQYAELKASIEKGQIEGPKGTQPRYKKIFHRSRPHIGGTYSEIIKPDPSIVGVSGEPEIEYVSSPTYSVQKTRRFNRRGNPALITDAPKRRIQKGAKRVKRKIKKIEKKVKKQEKKEKKKKIQKFFTGAELQMLMPLIQGAAGGQGGGQSGGAGGALSGLMGGGKPGGGEEPKKKKKKITVPRIKGFGAI